MAHRFLATAEDQTTMLPFTFRRCRSLPTIGDGDEMTSNQVLNGESSAERLFSEPPSSSTARGFYLSVPFLFLMLVLLCCFVQQLTMSVATSISVFLSVYLSFWIVSLRETTTGTLSLHLVMRLSYIPLLASFLGYTWRPFAGVVVMYLNTIVAAGSCGYALANHRQRAGTENSADIAALCLPLHQKTPDQKPPNLAGAAFFPCLASLAFAVWTVWVSCTYNPGDVAGAVMELSTWLAVCRFAWAFFVDACLMDCALFSTDTLQGLFIIGVMIFLNLGAVFGVIFADFGFATITWLTAMAWAGLFGYTLAVCHQYSSRRFSRQACEVDEEKGLSRRSGPAPWERSTFLKVVTHCLGLPTGTIFSIQQ